MDAPSAPRELLVADSFRVRVHEGRAEARGFSQHLARFSGSARQSFADHPAHWPARERTARLSAFLSSATARIAAAGSGFPRLELWREPDGVLRTELALRPLPELGATIELRSVRGIHRTTPERKGPNIALLLACNRELGAEALLLDPNDRVIEGATTSLVYWTDAGQESGHVIGRRDRVPSITEAILSSAADQRVVGNTQLPRRSGGFTPGTPTLAELQRCEVWAVNALHGIRPVSHVDGARLPEPEPARLAAFAAALARSWEPVAAA